MLRSKVYYKVAGNFGFLLLVLLALTILIINILRQMESGFTTSTVDAQIVNALDRLNRRLIEVPEQYRNYLVTGSETSQFLFSEGWKNFDEEIAEIDRITGHDSLYFEPLSQVKTLFLRWFDEIAEPQMALRTGYLPADSIRMIAQRVAILEAERGYLSTARTFVGSLIQQRIAAQQANNERALRLTTQLNTYIIVVNILFALFAIALGYVLTRSITHPLTELQAGTRNIMDGKYEPIEVRRQDEFGQLANDFNNMSMMLKETYTRVNAYSDMMTTLNTSESLKSVITESLNLLCQQSGSIIGALYLHDKETDRLELAAGYAMQESKTAVHSFRVGDGIPGQCAKLLKPIEVTDIPNLVQFPVETGLTTMTSKYIGAYPILFQETLAGVVLLGSILPFDELKKSVITNSLPQIGVAIINAQNHEATQKLSRELTEKHAELNIKTQELEKAYKVKSEFLSNMSHELRTPLNSIIGFASILLGERGDPMTNDQRRAMEKILKNGRHLLQLINDILDFSKIEAGRMHVSMEADTVESVVSNAIITAESLVRQKGLELQQIIEPKLPAFNTDLLKIKQIIVNLLSNAAKFTDAGVIEVRAFKKGSMIAIVVKDSGIGIAQENLERVFDEFSQIDTSHTRKYKGTGLGLPIARSLARLLGGDLVADSVLGKGSTFTLTVPPVLPKEIQLTAGITGEPAKPAPVERIMEKPAPPKEPLAKPVVRVVRPVAASEPSPLQKSAPVETPTSSRKKVLCIDDEPDVIEILRNYLVPEGYTVFEANSGDDGIKIAKNEKPDCITLDIMMPQKDGWQVLRELKSYSETKEIPVLVHSIIENKPLLLSLGAMDYLPKPTDRKGVLAMVEKAVRSKEQVILIVDDDRDYSSLVQIWLKESGYNSQIANDGYEALKYLDANTPSLIMLDIKMPGLSGFDVLDRLKANEAWKKIPVIIVSGVDLTKEQQEDLDQQMVEFLRKGAVTGETMSQYIKKVLA